MMARQGSGWSLAQCEERVTFQCEGCGRRDVPEKRFMMCDFLYQGTTYAVCSLQCYTSTDAEERRKERDGALHLLVCDTWDCYRCAAIEKGRVCV